MVKHVTPKVASRMLGVCSATLRRAHKRGDIQTVLTAGGQRRYDVSSYKRAKRTMLTGGPKANVDKQEEKKTAIYCRVSSNKQKDDLTRQVARLQLKYPDARIFTDIASGLNYKRKGLRRLLGHVQKGRVTKIVVAHKDRLARFGGDLIEWICKQSNVSIVYEDSKAKTEEAELVDDVLAVLHVFSCRSNGRMRYKRTSTTNAITPSKRKEETKRGVQGENSRAKEGDETNTGSRVSADTIHSHKEQTGETSNNTKAILDTDALAQGCKEDL